MNSFTHDVVVLGAGVVGVNTAYWLARAGREVTVVDREPIAANATSFANGGQISVCHAEPWATPAAPLQVLKWLVDPEAPLLFRPRLDQYQWRWLAQWLYECLPGRCRRNTEQIVKLALYSRQCLQQVREEHNLEYQQRTEGILHFYRTRKAFEAAKPVSAMMRELGCDRQVVSTEQVLEIEPALAAIADEIVGGTYTAEDESGNAHLYTRELQKVCEQSGVEFRFETEVVGLEQNRGQVEVLVRSGTQQQTLRPRQVVVCLGPWSAALLRSVGVSINVYPAKGYSITVPLQYPERAPTTSLTDDEYKLVISRLGNELRVAGTAELSAYSTDINEQRCQAILNRTRHFFPDIGGYEDTRFWAGMRPSTPSNVPYIGPTSISNLWLNTGHGTLGWTMGCGSGRMLADQLVRDGK